MTTTAANPGREGGTEGDDTGNGIKDPAQEAMEAAAASANLTDHQAGDATEYFLGRKAAPGSTTTFPLDIDFGELGQPDFRRCVFRTLRIEELDEADRRAEAKDKDTGQVIGVNLYLRGAWMFALACQEPRLGPLLEARNREGAKLPDAAALVADTFKHAPGTLLGVDLAIRRRARNSEGDTSVREVEAGKTSR